MDYIKFVELLVGLLDLVIEFIGLENTKNLITLTDVERAQAIADVAEYIKFGRTSDSALAPLPSEIEKLEGN